MLPSARKMAWETEFEKKRKVFQNYFLENSEKSQTCFLIFFKSDNFENSG